MDDLGDIESDLNESDNDDILLIDDERELYTEQ